MSADPFADYSFTELQRAMLDAHDAAVTIMMRGFAIQRAFLRGDWTGGPEAQSMVIEKVEAAQQGLRAAAVESLKQAVRSPRSAKGAPKAAARVAKAAAKPARKKAHANARRLTKAKKKR
jgi:hypothetical protein